MTRNSKIHVRCLKHLVHFKQEAEWQQMATECLAGAHQLDDCASGNVVGMVLRLGTRFRLRVELPTWRQANAALLTGQADGNAPGSSQAIIIIAIRRQDPHDDLQASSPLPHPLIMSRTQSPKIAFASAVGLCTPALMLMAIRDLGIIVTGAD